MLTEYTIDYGYNHATMVTDVGVDGAIDRFYKLAMRCFGIRKSITEDPEIIGVVKDASYPSWAPEGTYETLMHTGDTIAWGKDGNKIKDEWS